MAAVTAALASLAEALAGAGDRVLVRYPDGRGLRASAQRVGLKHRASAPLRVRVRAFERLADLERMLTAQDAVEVHRVNWSVDEDNPGWARVRADASTAALLKGQDYAAALGGTVVSVERVADAGRLGTESQPGRAQAYGLVVQSGSVDNEAATMTPVPQVLHAAIDA